MNKWNFGSFCNLNTPKKLQSPPAELQNPPIENSLVTDLRFMCSSHASATATCEQRRPKQGEGKDQASNTYK